MFWDNITENCDVCQCSSTMKSGFNLTERCSHSYQNDDPYVDKDNVQQRLGSPMKQDTDLSLYESSSSVRINCDGSPSHCSHQPKIRRSLEDHDNNSQDSGYGASCPSEGNKFLSQKTNTMSFNSPGDMDEDFLFICGLENDDENAQLPGDFNKLITGPILTRELKRSPPEVFLRPPIYRRAISLTTDSAANTSRARSCLFKQSEEIEIRSFKRPEPPTEIISPINTKRSKVFEDDVENIKPARRLLRFMSATEDSIKSALQRSSNEPDLIGDFSKSFCLPLTAGRHQDLKSISPKTLSLLMKGNFKNYVSSFKVIDCRYPYEYNGGHIDGAINIYTKQQVLDELLNIKTKNSVPLQDPDNHRRNIIVFHCEFSSERGPNLSRFLRQVDRTHNEDSYPSLHYPEMYLLDGGYKSFFEQHSEFCKPERYLPMLHPNYESDLRQFRAKSKTFNADTRSKQNVRCSSFKRL